MNIQAAIRAHAVHKKFPKYHIGKHMPHMTKYMEYSPSLIFSPSQPIGPQYAHMLACTRETYLRCFLGLRKKSFWLRTTLALPLHGREESMKIHPLNHISDHRNSHVQRRCLGRDSGGVLVASSEFLHSQIKIVRLREFFMFIFIALYFVVLDLCSPYMGN